MKIMHFIRNLFFLFTALSINSIYAQSLDDTEWLACNVYEDTTYIKFMNDSIYFKSEAVMGFEEYLPVSLYSTMADTLIWNDLENPEQCDPMITGFYNFEIISDSLRFYEIQDDCDFRLDVLSELILKRNQTTSVSLISKEDIKIFPNPFINYIQIGGTSHHFQRFELLSSSGTLIIGGVLPDDNKILIGQIIPPGIYFLSLISDSSSLLSIHKLVKL